MIRPFISCALFLAAACESMPTQQDQIVGSWNCQLEGMFPGDEYKFDFRADRSLYFSYIGSFAGDRAQFFANIDAKGSYALNDGKLSGVLRVMTINSLKLHGEDVSPVDFPRYEQSLLASFNSGWASPIDVLDGSTLMLKSSDGPVSCTRLK